MRMGDFIVEITEALEDLKKEKEAQEKEVKKAQTKAYSKSHHRR